MFPAAANCEVNLSLKEGAENHRDCGGHKTVRLV